jgi:hypothetical protein
MIEKSNENILQGYAVLFLFLFYYLVCEAIGTAITPGLLCQPWVIVKMIVEKQMECRLAGKTEVLGENLPQCHFCPTRYLGPYSRPEPPGFNLKPLQLN